MIKLKSLFRRGQSGPSNSKYAGSQPSSNSVAPLANQDPLSSNNNNLKGSSSISNIDGIGLSKSDKKKQKDFGSRDNLDKKDVKGSKERLVDLRPGKDKSKKESKRQPQPPQMSSVVQQQQQLSGSQHVGVTNPGLIEQQMNSLGGYALVDQHQLTKELTEINFDGPREDAKLIKLQELRQQLDRVSREKMAVEAKLVEMSGFQTEVVSLRNEISKMQVCLTCANDPLCLFLGFTVVNLSLCSRLSLIYFVDKMGTVGSENMESHFSLLFSASFFLNIKNTKLLFLLNKIRYNAIYFTSFSKMFQ